MDYNSNFYKIITPNHKNDYNIKKSPPIKNIKFLITRIIKNDVINTVIQSCDQLNILIMFKEFHLIRKRFYKELDTF